MEISAMDDSNNMETASDGDTKISTTGDVISRQSDSESADCQTPKMDRIEQIEMDGAKIDHIAVYVKNCSPLVAAPTDEASLSSASRSSESVVNVNNSSGFVAVEKLQTSNVDDVVEATKLAQIPRVVDSTVNAGVSDIVEKGKIPHLLDEARIVDVTNIVHEDDKVEGIKDDSRERSMLVIGETREEQKIIAVEIDNVDQTNIDMVSSIPEPIPAIFDKDDAENVQGIVDDITERSTLVIGETSEEQKITEVGAINGEQMDVEMVTSFPEPIPVIFYKEEAEKGERIVGDSTERSTLIIGGTRAEPKMTEVDNNDARQTDVEMASSIPEQLPAVCEKESLISTEICDTETARINPVSEKLAVQTAGTALSILAAAYDTSDSESEEIDCVYEKKSNEKGAGEMEVQITKEYRSKPQESSSEEDSESEDSSSEESSTSSEAESEESENDEDSDEDRERTADSNNKKNERNRRYKSQEKESKGEFDNLPPIEDLKISVPEVLCDPLGEVGWMVEQMVVVRPKPGKPTLNLDTILFVERGRRVLGRIFDVFGQVSEPHYCVRFNSTDHIKESDIKVGMTVYFCPNTEYTSVVFLQDLLKMKVADELGEDEHPEFSDDEEERAYFAALKQKQNNDKAKTSSEVPKKRQRTAGKDPAWKSNHPWSSGREQQQPQKTSNNCTTPDWSGNSQQPACHPPNAWHYPAGYQNNPWPRPPGAFRGYPWPAQGTRNSFGRPDYFGNRHPRPRQFFRPPQSFQAPTNPYMQNLPYAQPTNSVGYPGGNFSWQAQNPQQTGTTWPATPPPPPPPPGM